MHKDQVDPEQKLTVGTGFYLTRLPAVKGSPFRDPHLND